MASKTPFIYKSCPVFPGAFLVNGGGSFPIFCSTTNFSNCGMTDIDNSYIVMPGYGLVVEDIGSPNVIRLNYINNDSNPVYIKPNLQASDDYVFLYYSDGTAIGSISGVTTPALTSATLTPPQTIITW